MDTWQLNPIFQRHLGSGSYAVVVAIGVCLIGVWIVGVLFTHLAPRRRATLAFLRFCVVVLLLLAMLRPERVVTEMQPQSATLAILIDASRSMSLDDTVRGKTRWQTLLDAMEATSPSLAQLRDVVEIKAYVFDSELRAVDLKKGHLVLDAQPLGEQSDYGAAMREVLRREDGKRLIGVIVAGDGAQQTLDISTESPESAARTLAQWKCPLITIPFGKAHGVGGARDVAVESMPDDLVVFAKNRLTVTGTLRVSGYVNRDIPLQLVVDTASGKEQVVATERYRAVKDGELLRYSLSYIPEEPGEYRLLVRAPPHDGEVTTTNNELPTYVTVLEGGLRVLYLQGAMRPEQRFLRRALAASPDIDVTLMTLQTRDRAHWPVEGLDAAFQPGAYDVTILGDVDARAFHPGDPSSKRPADLELLAEAVRQGAGLLTLGGWHSYRPGGYHKTALASVLPIEMDPRIDRFVRQNFDEPIDRALHLPGPLPMVPAKPFGVRAPWMRLSASDDPNAVWRDLPPLAGANKFRGVKDGTQVLADDGKGHPLLVSGEPGGRVLAFAGDSTWRWVMHGQADAHRRFWRQAILWLARKDPRGRGDVWVKLDGRRFTAGQRVTFTTGAQTAAGDAQRDAALTASVTGPKGSRQVVPLVRHGDHFRGSVRADALVGTYEIEVEAHAGGKSLGADAARFLVHAIDRELSGVTADHALLENLAAQTRDVGGRLVPPEDLPALLEEWLSQPPQLEESVRLTVRYWDNGTVLFALIGLLCLEWFLRKRWQLV